MTRHATEFVRPLTFEALSGQPVIVEMYERPDYATIEHITLARQSNLLLVRASDSQYNRQYLPRGWRMTSSRPSIFPTPIRSESHRR
jgi:hypothetical protein